MTTIRELTTSLRQTLWKLLHSCCNLIDSRSKCMWISSIWRRWSHRRMIVRTSHPFYEKMQLSCNLVNPIILLFNQILYTFCQIFAFSFSSTFTGALVSQAMKTEYLPTPVWGEKLLLRLRVVNEASSSMAQSTGEAMPPVFFFLYIRGASSSVTGISWPLEALSDSSPSTGFKLQAVILVVRLPRRAPVMQTMAVSGPSSFITHCWVNLL